MRVAYVRVSTAEQNEERQLEALERFNIERWYTEKISGKNTNRPKLQEMLDFVREGDVVYVHDLSRLARSTKDLLSIVEQLDAKSVQLVRFMRARILHIIYRREPIKIKKTYIPFLK